MKKIFAILLVFGIFISAQSLSALENSDKDYDIKFEEDSLKINEGMMTCPISKIVIGPLVHLWVKADLSKKEFKNIFYNQEDEYIYINIEYLSEDHNTESYINWGGLIGNNYFTHESSEISNYYTFAIKKTNEKSISFTNDRVQIDVSGYNAYIYIIRALDEYNHDENVPRTPAIIGSFKGKPNSAQFFKIFSRSYKGYDLEYYINWGDGSCSGWEGPYLSCQVLSVFHSWDSNGIYDIEVKARDEKGMISSTSKFQIKITDNNENNLFGQVLNQNYQKLENKQQSNLQVS